MKNKKLFAILTLVCFMMTLMPVAAFAAPSAAVSITGAPNLEVTFDGLTPDTAYMVGYGATAAVAVGTSDQNLTGATLDAVTSDANGNVKAVVPKASVVDTKIVFVAANGATAAASQTVHAIYTMTEADEHAVAAADTVADSLSAVEAQVKSEFVNAVVKFDLSARNSLNTAFVGADDLWVWVTPVGSNIPVNTVNIAGKGAGAFCEKVATVTFNAGGVKPDAFGIEFYAAGNYQVHVSTAEPKFVNGAITAINEFNNAGAVVEIVNPSAFNAANVRMGVSYDGGMTYETLADGQDATALNVLANNVEEKTVTLQFKDLLGRPLAGIPLTIQAAGAIDVSKNTVVTSATGKAEFGVSGYSDGDYKIYVSFNKFEVIIPVAVGAVGANTIEVTKSPSNPIDILNNTGDILSIEFTMYDVNGNVVVPGDSATQGWDKAANSTANTYKGYVAIVEQPAASKLQNEHVYFDGTNVVTTKAITAAGDYTFKVVLDNGNYATASMTVKAFTTPVKLVVDYPATVELGSQTIWADAPYWLDANGVAKDAKGIELAATGYAVEAFYATDTDHDADPATDDMPAGTLIVKSDEKYVGSKITVTAVDERYDLITSTTLTVADEAAGLAFATETAEVKVNNKIRVNVVDANGNVVALGDTNTSQGNTSVDYVILDKPEGSKVFVSTVNNSLTKLPTDGYFTMNLTSDKVGTVKVQAVVRYQETGATGNNVVKYYTGIQEFAVGTGEIGKSVVMSIGSNELIVGSKVETMDAKPIVQNSRTFVPFRALAEAFGATVAYDQATSSVTAELNGVKVVMTVGAPVYTVNGVEKTADVAPFISDSRTFVPVRFAAEAFGIEVVPTYNEDGSVADVLFNM